MLSSGRIRAPHGKTAFQFFSPQKRLPGQAVAAPFSLHTLEQPHRVHDRRGVGQVAIRSVDRTPHTADLHLLPVHSCGERPLLHLHEPLVAQRLSVPHEAEAGCVAAELLRERGPLLRRLECGTLHPEATNSRGCRFGHSLLIRFDRLHWRRHLALHAQVGRSTGFRGGGLDAVHALVERRVRNRDVKRRTYSGAQLLPAPLVVGHRAQRGVDDRAGAFSVATRSAEQALENGDVLSADAVVQNADVRVVHRFGGVQHVLEDDERRRGGGLTQQIVDIRAGMRGGVPRDDDGVREPLAQQGQDELLASCARTKEVVVRFPVEVLLDGASDLVKGTNRVLLPMTLALGLAWRTTDSARVELAELLHEAKPRGLLERGDRLVLGRCGEAYHRTRSVHRHHFRRVGGADGDDANVALRPLFQRTKPFEHIVEVLVGAVVLTGGDVALVEEEQQVARVGHRGESLTSRLQTVKVLAVGANGVREPRTSLLPPGVVAHAGHDENVLDGAERVGEDQANDGGEDAGLPRLHFRCEMDPDALLAVEEAEALKGGCALRRMGLLERLFFVRAYRRGAKERSAEDTLHSGLSWRVGWSAPDRRRRFKFFCPARWVCPRR